MKIYCMTVTFKDGSTENRFSESLEELNSMKDTFMLFFSALSPENAPIFKIEAGDFVSKEIL